MTTEIAELPAQESAIEIYTKPNGLDPWLEKIKSEVTGHVPNLATKKGRDEIASLAFKVRKSKTALDALGKQLVDELKDAPKKVDAERKRMRDTLDALADEVRFPLTEWEQAEEGRVAFHKAGIQAIKDCGNGFIGGQPQAFGLLFYELEEVIKIDEKWEEFEAEAHREKTDALAKLKAAFAEDQKRAEELAELNKLRAEAEARAKADHEAAIASAAAAKAKAEEKERAEAAERKAKQAIADAEALAKAEREAAEKRELELKLAAETAERRRVEAEQKAAQDAKDAAERAEQSRLKAIQDEKDRAAAQAKEEADAASKREANKAHARKINRAALDALIACGVSEEIGQKVIAMIAKGEVPNVSIQY